MKIKLSILKRLIREAIENHSVADQSQEHVPMVLCPDCESFALDAQGHCPECDDLAGDESFRDDDDYLDRDLDRPLGYYDRDDDFRDDEYAARDDMKRYR